MMRSASRQALEAVREHEQSVLEGRISAATLAELASELYAVGGLLTSQPRLRRTLADPATSPDARANLAEQLLSGKIGKHALDLTQAAVRQRWSTPWDLADAIESAGDDALFVAAEKNGKLGNVEDELFRFERILEAEGEVVGLLDEAAVVPQRRVTLLDSLVEGKTSDITLALLRHAVTSQRRRSITLAIDDLLDAAAARQQRSVARVISATPLTSAQQERLTTTLSEIYGRAISVRTAIDPEVRGGLIVRVGDEVIDGSIATRFAAARNALAG
jgi:F-type H+-transporting ATPase subunit delta